MLPLGIAERFACPAKTVNNICDNDIGLVDHVLISLGDGISPRSIFKRWIYRLVISACIKLSVKVRQHKQGTNLRILHFQLANNAGSHGIELPVSAKIKTVSPLTNQSFKCFIKLISNPFRILHFPVSAECYYHNHLSELL